MSDLSSSVSSGSVLFRIRLAIEWICQEVWQKKGTYPSHSFCVLCLCLCGARAVASYYLLIHVATVSGRPKSKPYWVSRGGGGPGTGVLRRNSTSNGAARKSSSS
jgi:hypothetical protein